MFGLVQWRSDQRRVGAALIRFQCRHAGVVHELNAATQQRHDAPRPARDVEQIQVQSLLLKSPASFATQIGAMEPEIAP